MKVQWQVTSAGGLIPISNEPNWFPSPPKAFEELLTDQGVARY